MQEIKRLSDSRENYYSIRHLLRQLERINTILSIDQKSSSVFNKLQKQLAKRDNETRKNLAGHHVIDHSDGGFELVQMTGWKAANLAEIGRLAHY